MGGPAFTGRQVLYNDGMAKKQSSKRVSVSAGVSGARASGRAAAKPAKPIKSAKSARIKRVAGPAKVRATKARDGERVKRKPAQQVKVVEVSAPVFPKKRRHIPLHILSDSTGNLAQHMLTAFLTQFPADAFVIRRQNFLRTSMQLKIALDHVAEEPGIVCHAMVDQPSKNMIARRCAELGLPQCDLTGEFVSFLASASGLRPRSDVEALHDTSNAYQNRIKALEFTLAHDDGLGLDTVHRADIVLAGVSRTSKTPTSIYLAQQGYRVANVSLAMEVAPPPQLLSLRRRVVGLLIGVRQLVEIRTNRSVSWRMGDTRYNDPDHVEDELQWSRRLFVRNGWPSLDVTDQAVEETAARIVNLVMAGRPG